MRLTIIPSDGMVYVEGVALFVDCSGIDRTVHAVQWYGTAGEIEYLADPVTGKRKGNLKITALDATHTHCADLWNAQSQAIAAAAAAALAKAQAAPAKAGMAAVHVIAS